MSDLSIVEVTPRECPFCGSQGKVYERHNPMSRWKWSVDCSSSTCGMSGPVEASKADAITAWNTRPSTASEAERVREACAKVADDYVALAIPHVEFAAGARETKRNIAAAIRSLPIGGAKE